MTGPADRSTLDIAMPAGGTVRPDRVEGMGTPYKPLARLGDQYLTERVIAKLREWPRCGSIALAAGDEVLSQIGELADATSDDQGSGPANLQACLDILGDPEWVLLCGCDPPFLTGEICDRFLERCPSDADVCFSYVPAETYAAAYPGSPFLGLPLRGGRVVFGSLHLARSSVLRGRRELFERAFAARKKPWRMLGIIGLGSALRFAVRRLSLRHVEARISALLGCRCVAVESPDPAIAFDVDKPEHLRDARRIMGIE
ncbi:MAG: NTP transferase domain-containing protein [Armatimonadia bacterium]|nr:NTP transferase domain-containing protein [Armatimonadia bacterium]